MHLLRTVSNQVSNVNLFVVDDIKDDRFKDYLTIDCSLTEDMVNELIKFGYIRSSLSLEYYLDEVDEF